MEQLAVEFQNPAVYVQEHYIVYIGPQCKAGPGSQTGPRALASEGEGEGEG